MHWMFRILAFVTINALAAAGSAETYNFDGVFVPSDTGSYHDVEFHVPEGTGEVRISYSYFTEGEDEGFVSNVVDLGIYDPDGFRGWSGSAESSVTVALSEELTTKGYVPGPMPAGTWCVEIGAGYVGAGTTTSWEASVETVAGSGDPLEPPTWDPVVLGGPGWYGGDLHCHSNHSDGRFPVEAVFAYAHERGLQFIALTDHNGFTGHYEMPEQQLLYGSMLLIRGNELTSYRGHANVFGVTGYLDYHATVEGHDINLLMDEAHSAGGYFSVNHPMLPGSEPAEGVRVSLGWEVLGTDWSRVDFIEVLNGPSTFTGNIGNPFNDMAIAKWDELLLEGYRITAVGGSDDHQAGQGDTEEDAFYAPIGTPTTMVYAEELSEAGILAGLRAGHVYLKANSPDGPDLFLTATCGGTEAIMGDEVAGAFCQVEARAIGASGMELVVYENAVIREYVGIADTEDKFTYTFEVEPSDLSIVRVELRQQRLLQAMTNPVYLRFAEESAPASNSGCTCSSAPGRAWSSSLLFTALRPFRLALAGRSGI